MPALHALIPNGADRDPLTASWLCPCGTPIGWVRDDCPHPDDCYSGEDDCDGVGYMWVEHVIHTDITPPDLRVCVCCAMLPTIEGDHRC